MEDEILYFQRLAVNSMEIEGYHVPPEIAEAASMKIRRELESGELWRRCERAFAHAEQRYGEAVRRLSRPVGA